MIPELRLPFVKASACGNDFLLIEAREVADVITESDLSALTNKICDRHNGVGADGVEWIYLPDSLSRGTSSGGTPDARIRLVNADGSQAEISGNGTRCVAAYLLHCSSPARAKLSILTDAGLKHCELISRSGHEYQFEIAMGPAIIERDVFVQVGKSEVRGILTSMGNPHFTTFVKEFGDDWGVQAAALQRSPQFKNGINIEIVKVDGPHDVSVRFFERGVGETQSSGTGSCAAAIASVSAGNTEFPVRVHALGGTQTVREHASEIYLRGPARLVCRGEFFFDSAS